MAQSPPRRNLRDRSGVPGEPVSRSAYDDSPSKPPVGGFSFLRVPSRIQLFQDAETALWFLAQGYASAMGLAEEIAVHAEREGFLDLAGRIRRRAALRLDRLVLPG